MDLANSFIDIAQNSGVYSALFGLAIYLILQNIKNNRILKYLFNQNSKQVTPKRFKDLAQYNFYIKDILRYTLNTIKASRIMVVLYHNGEHSIGGYSFTKMSCVQEVTSSKPDSRGQIIPSVIRDFVNIPISAYSFITRTLFDKGSFTIKKVKDLKLTNNSTYEEFKRHKAKSVRFFPLVDFEGHIFGFICFEFSKYVSDEILPDELNAEEQCVLKVASTLELMTRGKDGKVKEA